jgi:hypothetical protein
MITRRVAVAGAALAAAIACGDYAHTNLYDPAVPVTIVIAGPDTLFSNEELAYYTAQITPSFPDSAISWGGATPIGGTDSAAFITNYPPLYPLTATAVVSASLGQQDTVVAIDGSALPTFVWRHSASKNVVITQRVVRIQLRCPDTHACDTLSAGSAWSVWVDGFDAIGQEIWSLKSATANPLTGPAIATFAVRDTTIASVAPVGIRAANVTALRTGTTWIVASRGPLLDSLQLVVQ